MRRLIPLLIALLLSVMVTFSQPLKVRLNVEVGPYVEVRDEGSLREACYSSKISLTSESLRYSREIRSQSEGEVYLDHYLSSGSRAVKGSLDLTGSFKEEESSTTVAPGACWAFPGALCVLEGAEVEGVAEIAINITAEYRGLLSTSSVGSLSLFNSLYTSRERTEYNHSFMFEGESYTHSYTLKDSISGRGLGGDIEVWASSPAKGEGYVNISLTPSAYLSTCRSELEGDYARRDITVISGEEERGLLVYEGISGSLSSEETLTYNPFLGNMEVSGSNTMRIANGDLTHIMKEQGKQILFSLDITQGWAEVTFFGKIAEKEEYSITGMFNTGSSLELELVGPKGSAKGYAKLGDGSMAGSFSGSASESSVVMLDVEFEGVYIDVGVESNYGHTFIKAGPLVLEEEDNIGVRKAVLESINEEPTFSVTIAGRFTALSNNEEVRSVLSDFIVEGLGQLEYELGDGSESKLFHSTISYSAWEGGEVMVSSLGSVRSYGIVNEAMNFNANFRGSVNDEGIIVEGGVDMYIKTYEEAPPPEGGVVYSKAAAMIEPAPAQFYGIVSYAMMDESKLAAQETWLYSGLLQSSVSASIESEALMNTAAILSYETYTGLELYNCVFNEKEHTDIYTYLNGYDLSTQIELLSYADEELKLQGVQSVELKHPESDIYLYTSGLSLQEELGKALFDFKIYSYGEEGFVNTEFYTVATEGELTSNIGKVNAYSEYLWSNLYLYAYSHIGDTYEDYCLQVEGYNVNIDISDAYAKVLNGNAEVSIGG